MSPAAGARPRKVLHLLNGAAGGAALSTIDLIAALRREGVEACAACDLGGTGDEIARLRDAVGGELLMTPLYWWNRKIRAARWKRPLLELRQSLLTGRGQASADRIARFAAARGADLIHTNTILTPEGGIAARRLGLAHVWHLRELVGPGMPFRLPGEGRRAGRFLAVHCSRLVANSEASAARIRPWLPSPELLEVVPNAVDVGRFTPGERAPGSPVVVAMVANLTSRWKRHDLFVEAAARVDRELPVEFRIYGHDPSDGGRRPGDLYCDRLHRRIAELGLGDRFRFPGFVPDPPRLMAAIDLLVHPAEGESFGRVAIEAMAAGPPVVGVAGGGIAEVVVDGETGLLGPPDDPGALAAGIERLVRDPDLRRRFGRAGRERVAARYSLPALTAGILGAYGRALGRPLGAAR